MSQICSMLKIPKVAWKSLLSAKLPAISRPIVPSFMKVKDTWRCKLERLTISLQAAVYPGALAAGTLHTTTCGSDNGSTEVQIPAEYEDSLRLRRV